MPRDGWQRDGVWRIYNAIDGTVQSIYVERDGTGARSPEKRADEACVWFQWENGRFEFYPWANILKLEFEPELSLRS